MNKILLANYTQRCQDKYPYQKEHSPRPRLSPSAFPRKTMLRSLFMKGVEFVLADRRNFADVHGAHSCLFALPVGCL
jgi:hypothetical protein